MHALVLMCINQHTKFEVLSITNTKYMIGQIKKTGNVTRPVESVINIEYKIIIFYLHTKFDDS